MSEYAVFLPVGWLLCRILDQGVVGLYATHHIYWIAFLAIVWTAAARHLKGTGAIINTTAAAPWEDQLDNLELDGHISLP